jgi:hypothetical protein
MSKSLGDLMKRKYTNRNYLDALEKKVLANNYVWLML